MSCSTNANRSALASAGCGVSKLAASSAYTAAAIQSRVMQAGSAMDAAAYTTATAIAPAAGKVLDATSRLNLKGGGKWALYGASLVFPPAQRALGMSIKAAALIGKPLSIAGNAVGDVSRQELVSSTVLNSRALGIFTQKTSVQAWSSRLTPLMNLNDLLTPGDRRNITSSKGVILKTKGKTWHSGTTTVRTPNGERTITHLQSLAMPPDHHYFNRPLEDREIAGITTGQMNPAAMSGYAGGIGGTEMLCGAWVAGAKQAAIKARIFGGPPNTPPVPTGPLGGMVTRLPSPEEARQAVNGVKDWANEVKKEIGHWM